VFDADFLATFARWTLIALAASPIIIGVGWGLAEDVILPRFIPRTEIDQLADSIMQQYPTNPEEAALTQEHAAWYRSEGFEQGKWRRVRKAIRARLDSGRSHAAS
jgi:hypothetical protein